MEHLLQRVLSLRSALLKDQSKIIIGKQSTLCMPAILKIRVCRISTPQMPSLIGCMDIIYAHDAHLNCQVQLLEKKHYV